MCIINFFVFFFFNDTATTEIYTLSLHDALPISPWGTPPSRRARPSPRRRTGRRSPPAHPRRWCCCSPSGSGGTRDRKSTRLNSSHANISYAVFCLKKKKKRHDLRVQRQPQERDA